MSSTRVIRVYLERKFLYAFKVVMILVAVPFALEFYEILTTQKATLRTVTVSQGEHWGFYAELIKNGSIALFFLWLGTLGSKEKMSEPRVKDD